MWILLIFFLQKYVTEAWNFCLILIVSYFATISEYSSIINDFLGDSSKRRLRVSILLAVLADRGDQHFLFPWTFPGDAWLWVCWKDFSRESPSWIVAAWGLPISLQIMTPQSLPALAQCIELLDPLMLWDENLRLYLWFTWKWEISISYCGTGNNLIRVTFFGPPCIKCNYVTTRSRWLNELGSWII